jgi:sugar lactone lactonase YvrE
MSEYVESLPPTVWCRADLELGEGPCWVDDRLFLVDILTGRLLESHPEGPGELRVRAQLDVSLGAAAPLADTPDAWIVAAGTGIALLAKDGSLDWLSLPAEGGSVPRRMNDATCDPRGRFWAGCMAWDATPGAGAVFRTDHDGTVTQVLDGLTIPNGPAFTADGSLMYLADSARGTVYTFPVDPTTGDLGGPTPFVELAEGSPDGMTVDDAGNLWVAIWGGGQVRQYAPDGTLVALVPLPARQPTAPCLGGPDGRRLFITTARHGLADHQRGLSGSVFAVDVPIPGPPAYAFG